MKRSMEMAVETKVFSSEIQRGHKGNNNNLYDLIELKPASYRNVSHKSQDDLCTFKPKMDKFFVPKKRPKGPKVRTVRDIRNSYEKEIISFLPTDLCKQEAFLLNKIREGGCGQEKTLKLARNLLKSDQPITRSTMQMLTNLNPNKCLHKLQYVLSNGTLIRLSGSVGGNKKFIVKYDIDPKKFSNLQSLPKTRNRIQNNSLLKKSLVVKFKGGPLSKKKFLDYSHQKYNVGNVECVKLPKIGIEVQPSVGSALDGTISNILHSSREANGYLTENWIEFAVSTCNSRESDTSKKKPIIFELDYSHNQNNLLMRCSQLNFVRNSFEDDSLKKSNSDDEIIITEMINKIISAVEINIIQDTLCNNLDEPETYIRPQSPPTVNINNSKDKNKKRYHELNRLDVTVIKVQEPVALVHDDQGCKKSFCSFGCVCASLETSCSIKLHCGRIDCMFECKCDFSKYKVLSSLDDKCNDLIPGLISLDNELNKNLAREEKKFRQTVVVTDQKSVFLKSQRRSLKVPKRYQEYYKNGDTKDVSSKKVLFINVLKIDLANIEPWCMVHSLYRCYCKGRFTENILIERSKTITKEDEIMMPPTVIAENSTNNLDSNICELKKYPSRKLRQRVSDENENSSRKSNDHKDLSNKTEYKYETNQMQRISISDSSDTYENEMLWEDPNVSRTLPYKGRKFSDGYYSNLNSKIRYMEKNDIKLCKRFSSDVSECSSVTDIEITKELNENSLNVENDQIYNNEVETVTAKQFPNKAKLVAWLESNYKHFKRRLESVGTNIPIEAPKLGKITLYPWEVLLERYVLKKNYFVVTKSEPFRIFLAINLNKPFFENCTNIDHIPFSDLRKYPITVKNIIDQVVDRKDSFYIMYGLQDCWELIGSVIKVNDKNEEEFNIVEDSNDNVSDNIASFVCNDSNQEDGMNIVNDGMSKWFLTIVENDFIEIQFHNRGFFVKYEHIIKAGHVARASNKTVRLSSQQKSQDNENLQFGLYVVPHENKNCVFIGPYELDEPLGIETLKSDLLPQQTKKTRGVWITTKASENINLIDAPSNFMSKIKKGQELIFLNDKVRKRPLELLSPDIEEPPSKVYVPKTQPILAVKPFKNSFSNMVNADVDNENNEGVGCTANYSFETPIITETFSLTNLLKEKQDSQDKNKTFDKPVAEVAPQINVEKDAPATASGVKRMMVLKPEQINEKLLQKPVKISIPSEKDSIESFLKNRKVCPAPLLAESEISVEIPKIVFIQCRSVENLGWIPGRKTIDNKLSFQFPGFNYSEYYDEDVAFDKINMVLSRKVYVPKMFNVEWRVVEDGNKLKNKEKLSLEHFGAEYVLTKFGLRHKRNLVVMKNTKGSSSQPSASTSTVVSSERETAATQDFEELIEIE